MGHLHGFARNHSSPSPRQSLPILGEGLDHTPSPVTAGDVGRCSPVSRTWERLRGQKRPGTLRCFTPEQRGLHALLPPALVLLALLLSWDPCCRGHAPPHLPAWLIAMWDPHNELMD